MEKIKKDAVLFVVGGLGYGFLEILCRDRTHWSMLIAGGICFIMFSYIAKIKDRSLIFKAALGALGVTAVELVFGVVFNIILKERVWDYSALPFNFLGQICLPFTLLWGALGIVFIPLAGVLDKKLDDFVRRRPAS